MTNEEIEQKALSFRISSTKGRLWLTKGEDPDKAIKYFEEAFKIAEEQAGNPRFAEMAKVKLDLARAYARHPDRQKEAIRFAKEYFILVKQSQLDQKKT